MVCASSNAVCDEIALRIIKLIPEHSSSIYRFYALSTKVKNILPELLSISSIAENEDKVYLPELKILLAKRVIVCTAFMSGRLALANIHARKPKHFSYVFIDECASVTEPDALIPASSRSKLYFFINKCNSFFSVGLGHAQVILSGDPQQLRAVVNSRTAQKLGYGIK